MRNLKLTWRDLIKGWFISLMELLEVQKHSALYDHIVVVQNEQSLAEYRLWLAESTFNQTAVKFYFSPPCSCSRNSCQLRTADVTCCQQHCQFNWRKVTATNEKLASLMFCILLFVNKKNGKITDLLATEFCEYCQSQCQNSLPTRVTHCCTWNILLHF